MGALFPYHALFPNQFPAGFKLGLDETNSFAALFQQPIQDRQHQLKRNKGNINRSKIQQLRYLFFGNMTDIDALQVDNALITAKFPSQLAVADIDGVDLLRAVLQHAVSEAARRGADVGRCLVLQPHAEFLHRLLELEAAAADVGDVVAEQPYLGLGLDRRAGLVDLLPVDEDLARHDHALRALAAAGQPPLDEQDVQSFFCHSLTLLFLSTILYHACIMRSRPAGSAARGCARPSHRAAGR